MKCRPPITEEEEEDLSGLHPGALLYRSAALQNFPLMADALAHGADVNWVNPSEESSTPMIQAVLVVSSAVFLSNTALWFKTRGCVREDLPRRTNTSGTCRGFFAQTELCFTHKATKSPHFQMFVIFLKPVW